MCKRTIICVVLAAALLAASLNLPAKASLKEEISPYSKVYLESVGASLKEAEADVIMRETIASLDDLYRSDQTLKTALAVSLGLDIPSMLSLDKEEKIHAMHLITMHYEKCDSDIKYQIYLFFKHYAQDSQDEESIRFYQQLKEYYNHNTLTRTESFKLNFNPTQAASWAYSHYDSFDSNFPNCTNLNGDCTNFVSQALYYGGMEMHANWYCYKLNNTYPAPANTTQLDYSWSLSDPSPWISCA
ncbi:MAG: amidase domain-containing protein [Lachnospiraceae bacterium]|nr:amidase domain-containing protein [Lachnospiraceae bacterium]